MIETCAASPASPLALGAVLVGALRRRRRRAEPTSTTAAGECPQVEAPAPKNDKFKQAASRCCERGEPATATVETSCGTFAIELDTESSPKTANSFAFLAEQGFYDGTIFHRIAPGFVIQGGDPTGHRHAAGPATRYASRRRRTRPTRTGWSRWRRPRSSRPGASGSQFFVVTAPADAGLPPDYAVLGEVTEGDDVVEAIGELGDPATEQPTQVGDDRSRHDRRRLAARSATDVEDRDRRPRPGVRARRNRRRRPTGSPTIAAAGSILAFYPGDFTPVCTRQFCSYRDAADHLDDLDAEVLGISPQSVELARAVHRGARAHRAAARRPRPRDRARLRRRRPAAAWCGARSSSSIPRGSSATATSPCSACATRTSSTWRRRCRSRRDAADLGVSEPAAPFTVDGRRRSSCAARRRGRGTRSSSLHGLTATRRYVVHGSRALPRARLSDDRLRRARPRRVGSRRPTARATATTELAADLGARARRAEPASGRRARRSLDGGAHADRARARRPRAGRGAGRSSARSTSGAERAEESLAYWDWLADGLERGGVEGFVEAYDRDLDPELARDAAADHARPALGCHRHPEAVAQALREVPRSRPFDDLAELEFLDAAGAGRRQPRRGRSRAPLRGRRGLGGAAAAGDADQRGAGRVAARLAGRAALARDRRLLRAPRGRGAARAADGRASAAGRSRAGARGAGPTRSRRSRRPCCRPGRRPARARGRRPR